MDNLDYDIIIIGGGPAGSTLARILDKDYKILLIDKKASSEKSGFKKPCGGLLSPAAQKSFGKFKLSLPSDILVSPQIFAVDTLDLNSGLKRIYQRFYLNMDRHKFDCWLTSMIGKNVDVLSETICTKIEKNIGYYEITYVNNSKENKASARYIIGADGASSIVRKTLLNKPIRQYLCIQKNYKANDANPYYVCFFDNNISNSYGWINFKNNVLQLGAALPIKTAKKDFLKLHNIFLKKGYNLNEELFTEACLVNSPSSISEIVTGKENAFLVGESAGFISTSSLEGISFALDSALALAKAFSKKGNIHANYNKNTLALKAKVFLKILKSKVIFNKTLRKLVMKSGITSFNSYES